MEHQVDLAEYLFTRLAQLGLGSVHGVPGDYNLHALDYIQPAGLQWVGNANELNAGYAADGYARIKGIGALITSYGVGELSAINAVACAYAEMVPVVHIVGTPPLAAQKVNACLHHSLGNGNLRVFADMYKSVTVAQANLNDPYKATRSIDATLRECLLQSRPVYIELPIDMVQTKVSRPSAALDFSIPSLNGINAPNEDRVVNMIFNSIQNAQRFVVLVDGFTDRFQVSEEVNELVKITKCPTLTTPFGKSIVKEDLPNFHGIYFGSAGEPKHHSWVQSCDLAIRFGPLEAEVNTFGFTAKPPSGATITFHKFAVSYTENGEEVYQPVDIKSVLERLLRKMKEATLPTFDSFPPNNGHPRALLKALPAPDQADVVDQYTFWLHMSRFFRPGDIILTETGTSSSGGQSFVLPNNTTLINSSIWLSIGYTLAASQGASLAQREMIKDGSRPDGRVILFEGDGSFQMTAQAISDIIRNRLDIVVFVLNNNGYTIERLIHGYDAGYNDIQQWRHLDAPRFFGAREDDPSYPVRTLRASNWGEMAAVLREEDVVRGKGLVMVEVMMDMSDAPESLKKIIADVQRRNAGNRTVVEVEAH